ncbi:efflux RND transporter periplasmic adaptor subunit [Ramlibacter sp. USB13]|uniref:Efflux RND transporter periplasmic adaptor subunit n=1 Tax=Ramlibacter cellulosilyticus TaxID=2764187 RepID=A0A923MRA4_9BURK|nr:efflux RND transporter periplasmic adaptor subunit [Ramlibacter cellulosilyticus]MBC5783735.1 efflux RND transporter periplasmic adaptor subunit [Ramlibacter cellulosilyticus]
MRRGRWVLVAGWLAPALAGAQALGCLIEPLRVSEVGSPVIGVIESTLVERGDRVRSGQPLATLRSDVERQSVAVAASKAQAVGELKATEANAELARQKLARAVDLANQQFISSQALEQARAEAAVAENRLAQAREQRNVFAREHELSLAQLGLRTIRSPISGIVVERYLSPGERVEEKAIYRVAMVHPLRVEVVLPATAYTSVRQGMDLTVTPEFPGATPRSARVTLVDKLIDGASNTFRVRMELPNADLSLPAGVRCKVDLALPSAPTRAPQRGRPPALDSSLNLQMAPVLVNAGPPGR